MERKMGNFCKYCGKQLVNGRCDCEDYQRENPVVNVPNQEAPQNQEIPQNQEAPQNQNNTQSQYQQAAKDHFNNSKNLFVNFLKNPIGMMSEVANSNDKVSPIILGVLHMIILVLICMIKIPSSDYLGISGGVKFSIGLRLALIIGVIVVCTASITFAFAKKNNPNASYLDVICVFCLTTIPSSIICLLALLLSYISVLFAAIAVIMAIISWVMLCNEAVQVSVEKNKDICFWLTIIIIAIVMTVIFIITKSVVQNYINGAARDIIDNLSDIF